MPGNGVKATVMGVFKERIITRFTVLAAATALFCLLVPSSAEAKKEVPLNTKGRMRLEVSGVFGRGVQHETVGTIASTGEPIRISAGGGAGPNITLGMGVSKYLDIDVTGGQQKSANRENAWNSETEFTRYYLLGTFKLKFPMKTKEGQYKAQFKLGAGAGYYFNAVLIKEMEDMYTLAPSSTEIGYKDTIGYHLTAEFETITPNNWSFVIGFRAYYVVYEADTYSTTGGGAISSGNLADLQEFNGSGLDLKIGFGKYLW